MSPSYHHAYIAGNLIAIFHALKSYSVFSELTLQIGGKDYVPDISLYPKRTINYIAGDIIRMTEMPLLVVEVLSPSQGSQEILEKFSVYFGSGIQSCWLVVPLLRAVMVYSAMEKAQSFHTGEVIDSVLKLRVPLDDIFA